MSFNAKLYVFAAAILNIGAVFAVFYRWESGDPLDPRNAFEMVAAFLCLGSIAYFIVYLDQGYRVAFDDAAIYTRPHGI